VDVVGVGENATDTLIRIPRFPPPDSKLEFLSAEIQAGGQVASAIVACARWGLRTRYIGKVGDDDAGRLQQRELDAAGVESYVFIVENCASQQAFILVDEKSAHRTILWKRDQRLKLAANEIRREWIASARVLHLDGCNVASGEQAAVWAREAGIPVVIDVDTLYPQIECVLPHVDYVLASREFPERLTGLQSLRDSLPAIAARFGNRVVASTLGADGVVAWDGRRLLARPAFNVAAIDTTGAGDIFHGAFLYSLLQDWELERRLDFSCAAAGLNCTALGARGGIRSVEEIERLRTEGSRTGDPQSYL
jgi:sugar/nucleoside kinase (ribokinase family)